MPCLCSPYGYRVFPDPRGGFQNLHIFLIKFSMKFAPIFRRICQRRPYFRGYSTGAASDVIEDTKLLPSAAFLKEVQKRHLSDKLGRLIAEIEIIRDISHEVPLTLSDSQWDLLLHMRSFDDRHEYIRSAFFKEVSKDRNNQENSKQAFEQSAFLAEKQRRYENGEIVYGRGFYDYLDLRGRDFRAQADALYGARLLAQERVDEKMPQIIVDCRYLGRCSERWTSSFVGQVKTLYDQNWFSPKPFTLSIANLLMDDYVARLVRKSWYFALGVPSCQTAILDSEFPEIGLAEFEDLDDLLPGNSGDLKHPLAPRITSRGVSNVLDPSIEPSEVAFISKRSNIYLDTDNLANFKAFVLSTNVESGPRHLSNCVAAGEDGFKAYRLPIEKYVKWMRGSKELPIPTVAAILRDVTTGDLDWRQALLKHIPAWHLSGEPLAKRERPAEVRMTGFVKAKKLEVLNQAIKDLNYRHISPNTSKTTPNRTRVHRYSREDRRQMRLESEHPSSSPQ
uniref:SAM-dependent MTase TRM10-type domain-containing protein n=1 Tax=Panagrellus redivivus TaxID=6233 RepID=A0A7E4VUY1_PANRE